MPCPSENQLARFVSASIAGKREDALEEHVASCDACRNIAFALSSAPAADRHSSEGGLAEGTALGRFRIERELGRGAMGVIYLAFDPELERQVALKLGLPGSALDAEGQERLRREAQSLARLSHPNVVSVFEAGSHDSRVFLVMEYVEGATLEQWLRAEPRPPAAILEVFAEACAGLHAVHSAGLVHRDVKPSNLMLSTAAQVKLTDFGLVRTGAELRTALQRESPDLKLSQTGATIGTPAYMAPEQLDGKEATARSDQFSLCVALYEALYGRRPFAANGLEALRRSMTEPPRIPKRGAPARVRKALLRGLAADPEARFSSMADLQAALRGTRRPVLAGSLALAVAGTAALAWQFAGAGEASPSCAGFADKVQEHWSEARREKVRGAFLAVDASYKERAWQGVQERFDERAESWIAASRRACLDGRAGRQSPRMTDLRMACLSDRLGEWEELLAIFETADDADIVKRAQEAATGLRPLDACSDLAGLTQGDRPIPEALVDEVARLDGQLQRALALARTGQMDAAAALIDRVLPEVRAAGYGPLLARALSARGDILGELGEDESIEDTLLEAIRVASQEKLDPIAARSWNRLVYVIGYRQARYADGHTWAKAADAAILRTGNPAPLRIAYHLNLSNLLLGQGKLTEALAEAQSALQLSLDELGPEHLEAAKIYNNLGAVLQQMDRYPEAKEHLEHALAIDRRAHGDAHPEVAIALTNLGYFASDSGQPEEALAYLQKALPIWEASMGPEHHNVGVTLENTGLALVQLGRYQEARAAHQRAYDILQAKLPAEHPRIGFALFNLARVAARLGESESALVDYAASRELLEKALGADHEVMATVLMGEGGLRARLGQHDEALQLFERALEIAKKKNPEGGEDAALVLINLGQFSLDRGRSEEASTQFERALASLPPGSSEAALASAGLALATIESGQKLAPEIREVLEGALSEGSDFQAEDRDRAMALWALARVLHAGGENRERVERLTVQAAEIFEREPFHDTLAKQLRDWLRAI